MENRGFGAFFALWHFSGIFDFRNWHWARSETWQHWGRRGCVTPAHFEQVLAVSKHRRRRGSHLQEWQLPRRQEASDSRQSQEQQDLGRRQEVGSMDSAGILLFSLFTKWYYWVGMASNLVRVRKFEFLYRKMKVRRSSKFDKKFANLKFRQKTPNFELFHKYSVLFFGRGDGRIPEKKLIKKSA